MRIAFKRIGRKKPVFEYEYTDISKLSRNTTKDLIELLVYRNVREYNNRIQNQTVNFLTHEEIVDQSTQGKIFNEGKDLAKANTIDSLESAFLAFEDGIYKIFIDDVEIKSLHEILNIKEDSEVIFIKLVMLSSSIRWW